MTIIIHGFSSLLFQAKLVPQVPSAHSQPPQCESHQDFLILSRNPGTHQKYISKLQEDWPLFS
jgi:hypothetical protein